MAKKSPFTVLVESVRAENDNATLADVRNELQSMLDHVEEVAEEHGDDATLDALKW